MSENSGNQKPGGTDNVARRDNPVTSPPVPGVIAAYEEVNRELAKVPGLKYEHSPNRVRVQPLFEEGFPVEIFAKEGGGYTVYFSVWNENFHSEDDALDCFFFGLSDDCRLEVTYRGAYDYRWTMQSFEDEEWVPYSTTAMIFFPFWSPKKTRYLQNKILKAPEKK